MEEPAWLLVASLPWYWSTVWGQGERGRKTRAGLRLLSAATFWINPVSPVPCVWPADAGGEPSTTAWGWAWPVFLCPAQLCGPANSRFCPYGSANSSVFSGSLPAAAASTSAHALISCSQRPSPWETGNLRAAPRFSISQRRCPSSSLCGPFPPGPLVFSLALKLGFPRTTPYPRNFLRQPQLLSPLWNGHHPAPARRT